MKTQVEQAQAGCLSSGMVSAAKLEQVPPESVCAELASGRAVLPANPGHANLRPVVIGRVFRTKVNANIGRSPGQSDLPTELCKLQIALTAGADLVMDLSVGEKLASIRSAMIAACPAPFGTVPIYEAVSRVGGHPEAFNPEVLLEVIAEQAAQGVDFMTLHAGLLRRHVGLAMKRLAGIVSRGGAILADWMTAHNRENPLYEHWDEVLDICRDHDVTVSLGDGLRPGCLADASDAAQFAELEVMGALVRRCRQRGVQVMVEGPGHVPFNQIQMNMEREAQCCDGAPFYVLGPVVTDVAPGYDHITSCIGATAAAYYGAALLCYVTPAEHLGLPTAAEVREGVMAYRIAAHAADVARGLPGARDWDDAMTRARVAFDWNRQFELALDGERARKRFQEASGSSRHDSDYCTMCGADFCAMRISKKIAARMK
ncbi:MAG: phosphomethylpyrimidine synthase ThiC [Verrucomicrobia bacterium]|nr:phosphomethylpyrimidine synthase ThiC [Verrucomicrobiota bacterium]MBU4246829.1 phosphomethylpyrimidine synthase ThiC [Verrucomicrobiota bacterium]MBU4291823.1 phosphomethylpyrimidine synthase ThiC [Verrucomicrobiota bacterium]MBU4429425.1 phosphomethylpyrimidine synthase ThiC [Verrucomicrobiota bacterium]MCG2680822.1 phosphomethylpyrimidine synthase ThiC [Kiritimatiellia bacterium]